MHGTLQIRQRLLRSIEAISMRGRLIERAVAQRQHHCRDEDRH
jgi:hypothetical protein